MIRSNQRGFSILELLVSITILSILMMGIGVLYSKAMQATTKIKLTTRAVNIAQSQAEELDRLPGSAAELTAGSHGPTTIENLFNLRWDVLTNNPMRYMRRVTINVSWNNIGRQDSVRIVTYLKPR